jgi:hypothetical protein
MRKVVTTVYLGAKQLAALKALSRQTHVPVTEYIRQGIDKILDTKRGGSGDDDQSTAQSR